MSTHIAPVTAPVSTELTFDFAQYLAQTRRVSREAALQMLGESILDYQPDTEALRARRTELAPLLAEQLSGSAS